MAAQLFGAIDVGSYEIGLTVSEFSKKNGIRVIDRVSHRINLGTDTFRTRKISPEHVEELKQLLLEYRHICEGYGVKTYRACGTSAIREMVNSTVVLDAIEQQTGVHIECLSNSEQRFLDYKSVAARGEGFVRFIEKPTAILDIGGSSIQISLFNKDRLVTTQNLKLGVLRLNDALDMIDAGERRRDYVIKELIDSQLTVFQNLYLKGHTIENIILVDDYISPILQHTEITGRDPGYIDAETFRNFMDMVHRTNAQDLAKKLQIADDNIPLVYISGMLLGCIIEACGANMVWAPGVTLCDGMNYDFASANGFHAADHDFDEDIIACASSTAQRYMGLPERGQQIEDICVKIFDAMKKYHGLGARERLLLRIASILYDCGKYISMTDVGKCSFDIIMATEIIGISHIEREIVASVVRFNHDEFQYYGQLKEKTDLDPKSYLTVAKLTAILRLANGLERSHQMKFRDVKVRVSEGKLVITVPAGIDLTMEKGLFRHRAEFFEEVYGVRPVIRQTKK